MILDAFETRTFGKQVGGDIIENKKPIYILKQLLSNQKLRN
jgi:hypothetical protein